MFYKLKKFLFAFVLLFSFSVPVFAQGFSNQGDASADTARYTSQELLNFSKKVEKSLADKKAVVAIVSRVGRPESELPPGVKYTHVAFWVYSDITTKDGKHIKGYQVYNLYQKEDKKNISILYKDFPVDFFAGTYDLKSGIIIPKLSLQQKLLNIINSSTYEKLHNPHYSVVAKVDSKKYQNCTSFVVRNLFSALYQTNNISQINKDIETYFTPQEIKIGSIKRLLGGMFVQDFYPDEHGDQITTATFGSIAKFMNKYNLASDIYEISK